MTYVRAVSGILKHKESLLIARRPDHKPLGGFWEFPGGKIEAQETLFQALFRELKEEIGVEIDQDHTQPLLELHNIYGDHEAHISFFLISKWSCVPQALEGQRLEFVLVDQLEGYTFLPGLPRILKALHPHMAKA